ncbi:hypothetical protein LTR66_006039 [Elasticomyces elasticus]|nr:hypothetical protein LTR66_006039 [Elasticomyces elasticus]
MAHPVVEIPVVNRYKRKRSDSQSSSSPVSTEQAPPAKRHKISVDVSPAKEDLADTLKAGRTGTEVDCASREAETTADTTRTTAPTNSQSPLSPLQVVIMEQFNMEILLKHRELRTIEQELAKCHVALEQLQKCEEIPYGANNIPYRQHYSRWLLPTLADLEMEPASVPQSQRGRQASKGTSLAPNKSRALRDNPTGGLQALPNYPVQGQNSKSHGPQIIRRSADGQWVKLVCKYCGKVDHKSAQGFLNHCRIAHRKDYKTHEAAAIDCGQILAEDELHLVPSMDIPKSAGSQATYKAQPYDRSHVHAFNTPHAVLPTVSPMALVPPRPAPPARARQPQQGNPENLQSPSREVLVGDPVAPLQPSQRVPYLSQLFARRGFGGNLEQATRRAITATVLDIDDDGEETSPATPVASEPFARPVSRKGYRKPAGSSHGLSAAPSSRLGTSSTSQYNEVPESPHEDLSPHTLDSNPGLVSDHEDDDDDHSEHFDVHMDEDSERIGASAMSGQDCGTVGGVDVVVDDHGDEHGVVLRPTGLAYAGNTMSRN